MRRTGNTSSPLTVTFSVSDTATAGSDYTPLATGPTGTVVIPAGSNNAPLPVGVLDDAAVEGSETVSVTLVPPSGSAYAVGAAGSDTVTIVDDDLIVSVVATDPYASESGPNTGTFTLSRNSTLGELTVYYYEDGTATPDHGSGSGDFVGLPGTLTFANGQASATVTLTPRPDTEDEDPETAVLVLVGAEYALDPTAYRCRSWARTPRTTR